MKTFDRLDYILSVTLYATLVDEDLQILDVLARSVADTVRHRRNPGSANNGYAVF